MKVYILSHKEGGGIIYGATDSLLKAIDLRRSFPNPDPIVITKVEISNNQQFETPLDI